MGAILNVYQEDFVKQDKLFNLMLNRQQADIKNKILKQAYRDEDRVRVGLFTRHYNISVLHYELLHFRDLLVLGDKELEPDREFQIFKAYFLVAEQWANPNSKASDQKPEFNEDYFAKMMWPDRVAQFDLSNQ